MRLAGAGEVSEWTRHKLSAIWGDPDEDIIRGIADRMVAGDAIPSVALVSGREIVDGWHRVRAARLAGVGLYVEDLSEQDDLVSRVLAGNMLRRRHTAIEATKLAILTLEASGWRLGAHGGDRASVAEQHLLDKYLKNEDIAKLCGVGFSTITKARRELEYERNPLMAKAREDRLEGKRLQRQEEENEYQEARDATERERARESEELETLRAKVTVLEAVPDLPEGDSEEVVAVQVQEIIDPVVKRNEELIAQRDQAWAEVDQLNRQIELLKEENEHLRRTLKIFEDHARKQADEL